MTKADDIEWPESASKAAQDHLEQQALYLFDRSVQQAQWADALSVSPAYVNTAAQQLRIGKKGVGPWADALSGVGGIILGATGGLLASDYAADEKLTDGSQTVTTIIVLGFSIALTAVGYAAKILNNR